MAEQAETTDTETGQQNDGETQTFTQADLDRVTAKARAEERRKATERYADYDTLKSKAEGTKTLEDRLAELQQRTAQAEARALRSDIAAKYKISAEDRDLFLTGVDEESLEAQAKRLAERDAANKTKGNVARREGDTKQTGTVTNDVREFTRRLFGDRD